MKLFLLLVYIGTALSNGIDFDKFYQHDYKLIVERAQVPRYDKKYMNYASMSSFKYNRTNIAVNITMNFKVLVGNDLIILVQVYKFASNEYRLFPLRMQENFCKGYKANVAGVQNFINCGNFVGCPFPLNTNITICNFIPDDSRLPPYLPSGSYLMEFQMLHVDIELFVIQLYVKITRPEVKK